MPRYFSYVKASASPAAVTFLRFNCSLTYASLKTTSLYFAHGTRLLTWKTSMELGQANQSYSLFSLKRWTIMVGLWRPNPDMAVEVLTCVKDIANGPFEKKTRKSRTLRHNFGDVPLRNLNIKYTRIFIKFNVDLGNVRSLLKCQVRACTIGPYLYGSD